MLRDLSNEIFFEVRRRIRTCFSEFRLNFYSGIPNFTADRSFLPEDRWFCSSSLSDVGRLCPYVSESQ